MLGREKDRKVPDFFVLLRYQEHSQERPLFKTHIKMRVVIRAFYIVQTERLAEIRLEIIVCRLKRKSKIIA
jgi:hypothetical protein